MFPPNRRCRNHRLQRGKLKSCVSGEELTAELASDSDCFGCVPTLPACVHNLLAVTNVTERVAHTASLYTWLAPPIHDGIVTESRVGLQSVTRYKARKQSWLVSKFQLYISSTRGLAKPRHLVGAETETTPVLRWLRWTRDMSKHLSLSGKLTPLFHPPPLPHPLPSPPSKTENL